METFQPLIAEALEVDAVDMKDELSAFESWDSLTVLSIIALISEEYNVELTAEDVENSKTVEGLQELVKSRL